MMRYVVTYLNSRGLEKGRVEAQVWSSPRKRLWSKEKMGQVRAGITRNCREQS